MEGYSAKIIKASKELNARERVALKNANDLVSLDKETQEKGDVRINVDFFAELEIHNEHAKEDKDYHRFVIVDKDGTKYSTGSASFIDTFLSIYDELKDEGETEEIEIRVFRLNSRNREGKQFITCSLL